MESQIFAFKLITFFLVKIFCVWVYVRIMGKNRCPYLKYILILILKDT